MSNPTKYKMSTRRQSAILELLDDFKNKKVLDVGCSDGEFGKLLQKKGAQVFGVDLSERAIKKAKKVIKAFQLDLNTQRLPFKNNTFDIVIFSETIEHLFNPIFALKEIHKVLKKDGYLVITTPNIMYWGNRLKFLRGEFKYEKVGMFDETHFHFYTYKTLKSDLQNAGFKIIEENNVFISKIVKSITKNIPSVFAYQFVFKCDKR